MTSAGSIFDARLRTTTIGVIVLMTIIAFEAMAVATALPTAASDLHGLGAYGWAFTGFLTASVVGMVASGLYSDQRGPAGPLIVGLIVFASALVFASFVDAMWLLVAARFLQGLAVGLLITAMYVVMGEVYDDALRPRMFAALATAWVVPGLVGPIVAGWLTENLSWRWVFGGLAPLVVLGGVLILPSLRRLRAHDAGGPLTNPSRVAYALLTAAGIAAVANAGTHHSALAYTLAIAGIVAMVLGLQPLLPSGTVRLQSGVPAAVGYRGIVAGVFFGMEALVPLTLKIQDHYSPTRAGLPLMLTALSWAVASNIQGRLKDANRPLLVATGLVCMVGAGALMVFVALTTLPGWMAYVAWPAAGFGAGFALTSASVVLLECTTDADRGRDSAALQLSDSSAGALSTALTGALVAAAAHGRLGYGAALAWGYAALSVCAVLALVRVRGLRSPVRSADLSATATP